MSDLARRRFADEYRGARVHDLVDWPHDGVRAAALAAGWTGKHETSGLLPPGPLRSPRPARLATLPPEERSRQVLDWAWDVRIERPTWREDYRDTEVLP